VFKQTHLLSWIIALFVSVAPLTARAALTVTPNAVTMGRPSTQQFTVSGGTPPYAWSVKYAAALTVATIDSNGLLSLTPGQFVAFEDSVVVTVTDSAANSGTASVLVLNGVVAGAGCNYALAGARPRSWCATVDKGSIAFTPYGFTPPYTWSFALNQSGGTVDSNGVYTAGLKAGNDQLSLTDANGNETDAFISVAGPVPAPLPATLPPRGTQTFTVSGGGGGPYSWSIAVNNSGGSIDSNGKYTAGPIGNVVDSVAVSDQYGGTTIVSITVTAGVAVAPSSVTLVPRASQIFTASDGAGPPYTWSLTVNNSGGSIDANGKYTAGRIGSVVDTVRATDGLGNINEVAINVSAAIAIVPGSPSIEPMGKQTFFALGGSGSSYSWALTTNNSGGNVDSAGHYVAGPKGNSVDTIQVTDSLGNTATADIGVTGSIRIWPAAPTVEAREAVFFIAVGGSGVYSWSLTHDNSGGSIDANGNYVAGSTGGVVDTVKVTDSLGNAATVTVTVNLAQPCDMGSSGKPTDMAPPNSSGDMSPSGNSNGSGSSGNPNGSGSSGNPNGSGSSGNPNGSGSSGNSNGSGSSGNSNGSGSSGNSGDMSWSTGSDGSGSSAGSSGNRSTTEGGNRGSGHTVHMTGYGCSIGEGSDEYGMGSVLVFACLALALRARRRRALA
jgi:hypothetical protein